LGIEASRREALERNLQNQVGLHMFYIKKIGTEIKQKINYIFRRTNPWYINIPVTILDIIISLFNIYFFI
jgi:hypothetical protein